MLENAQPKFVEALGTRRTPNKGNNLNRDRKNFSTLSFVLDNFKIFPRVLTQLLRVKTSTPKTSTSASRSSLPMGRSERLG